MENNTIERGWEIVRKEENGMESSAMTVVDRYIFWLSAKQVIWNIEKM